MHELRDFPAGKSQIAFLPAAGAEVDDIDGVNLQMKKRKFSSSNEEPRTAADGKKYATIHPELTGVVLVELIRFKSR